MSATGFLKGFFDATADGIEKKKDQADAYFNQQMEMAHKVGMQNHLKRQELMQGSLQTAEKLLSAGVPRNIVMGVANQNPDDLNDLLSRTTRMQEEGVQMTPAVWEALVEVRGEFDPNMSMRDFISQIYTPLSRNMQNSPENFRDDPKGSIWATMMGSNAMDRARTRLETTEVADGMSAADMLRTGASARRPVEGASVSYNYNEEGDLRRAAKDRDSDFMDIRDLQFIRNQFDEKLLELRNRTMRQLGRDLTEEELEDLRYTVGQDIADMGIDPAELAKLGPTMRPYFFPREDEPVEEDPIEEVVTTVLDTASPTGPSVTTEPSTSSVPTATSSPSIPSDPVSSLLEDMPIDPEDEPDLAVLPGGETFVRDNGDGTSVYKLPTGEEVVIENKVARRASKRSGLRRLETPIQESLGSFMDLNIPETSSRQENVPTLSDIGITPDWENIREGNRSQRADRNRARRERNRARRERDR